MNKLNQILLILAIIVTAFLGVGFGTCGAIGMVAALSSGEMATMWIFALGLAGAGIAVGAVFLVRSLLREYRRQSGQDDD